MIPLFNFLNFSYTHIKVVLVKPLTRMFRSEGRRELFNLVDHWRPDVSKDTPSLTDLSFVDGGNSRNSASYTEKETHIRVGGGQ